MDIRSEPCIVPHSPYPCDEQNRKILAKVTPLHEGKLRSKLDTNYR